MTSPNLRSKLLLGVAAGILSMFVASPAFADDAAVASDDADARNRTDEIVVSGERSVNESSSGTKSNLPLAETPQSITVIDAARISDLGLQNLNQALRFVAGVTPETRGSSAEVYDQFKLRGFDAPVFLDGLKQFGSATGYAQPQVDLSRLDRIEVVKGAASALYGASSPGGFINQQSKLPIDRAFYGAVSGTYGNYDLYRVDADIGGRIGKNVLARVYGSVNGADAQQDIGERKRRTVSAAVTVGAGTSTDFTVLGVYSHDPQNGNYGVFPAVGTLIRNEGRRLPTSFYGGEPDDFFRRNQYGLTYIFNHDFGGGWTFRSSGRYQNVKSALGIVYTGGSQASPATDPDIYARYSYATDEELNNWTYDNQLKGTFTTGPLTHELLLGVDRQVAHSTELVAFGGGTPIDGFDPNYGSMPSPRNPNDVFYYSPGDLVVPSAALSLRAQQRQQGVYAQDQISVGGLRVILSGRQDWARQASSGQVNKDKKFTYRAGALYKTAFGLAPYVSYSTSFEPQASQLADGTLAKPSLGKQFEAGAKYQIPGTDILISGAWFNIEQTNVVVSSPVNFLSYQVGKVRSRGVEVEASGTLPYDFDFHVAFSRQKVKTLEDADPARVGRGLPTVGRGGISADLAWAPKSGSLEGLRIGGVVRHVDRTYAGPYTNADLSTTEYDTPNYTLVDALLRYNLAKISPSLSGVTLGVNATNVFDKKYLTSCFANYAWCWYGNRRTVQGTIGFSW